MKWTYVDELESIPDVQERSGGLFETDNGGEAEDVDAEFEQLVEDVTSSAKDIGCGFRDTLRRDLMSCMRRRDLMPIGY